jgi:hypothetical protein
MSLTQLEPHHPMKDVKILKYIMPRVSVPMVYLKTFFVAIHCSFPRLPYYLGQFDTNYIIFKNVEIFKDYFFQIKKYCEEK